MSITSFTRLVTKTVAGNYEKLFIGRVEEILSTTWTTSQLDDITMKFVDGATAPSYTVGAIEVDIDSVHFTSEGEATRGYFSEQTMIFKIAQKTTESEALIEELLSGSTAGLFVIRVDRQGKGWVSGISPTSDQFINLPWLTVADSFDSGESIESVDEGNRSTITLTRKSGTREYAIDTTETTGFLATLLDGTHGSLSDGT